MNARTARPKKPAVYAAILAGGRGERFWPVGRASRPKQFVDLFGGKPLIALAVERLRGLTLARDPSRFGRTTVNWRLEFAETPVPGVVFGRPEMPFRGGDRLDAVFHFARDNFGAPQFFLRDLRRA